MRRSLIVRASAALVGALACGDEPGAPSARGQASAAVSVERALRGPSGAPTYVGRGACAACHPAESEAWARSDHDRATMTLDDPGVTADFTIQPGDPRFRWQIDGDAVAVVVGEGEGEAPAILPIRYALGVRPLQQFLVDGGGGRLQALPVAWDARPAAAGGQRWFTLEEAAGRWTGPAANWNHACAECHSTDLRKNYDPAADAFATTFAELDVACEACHGPGSGHLAWARGDRRRGDDRRGFTFTLRGGAATDWRPVVGSPTARRRSDAARPNELEVCARCHSHRTRIADDVRPGAPLLDTHVPSLLEPPAYFDDGQIRGEVFVYGAFLQSAMHAAGVTCSDCHDPHSLALRAPGDALCGRCHDPATFARAAHHHHPPASAGARCASCHMPARTYMEVDPRRDHGIRAPRPDLSAALGTPDACAGCHPERDTDALAGIVAGWGVTPPSTLSAGEILARARAGDPAITGDLVALVGSPTRSPIVRATAASLLGAVEFAGDPATTRALAAALHDDAPLVRLGALRAVEDAPPAARWALASHLLGDRLRAVRIAAARALAAAGAGITGDARAPLEGALGNAFEALALDEDRPEAAVLRGNLLVDLGDLAGAERAYARALALDPEFAAAAINGCELLRRRGDEEGCAARLDAALERAPESPELHYARALSRVRRGRHVEAIPDLRAAARLEPDEPRYAYALVVLLRDHGDPAGARRALAEARGRHPHAGALRALEASMAAR